MSKIVFEVATFADAIKKADRLAPTRGHAFDKAAGIVLEFNPAGVPMAVVRSTNLELYCMEWIDLVSMEGDPVVWRFPKLFGSIVSGLPIGSGKEVSLEEVGNQVVLKAGRMVSKFNLIRAEDYPRWDPFDPDEMFPAKDLGGRIGQVEWAVSKDIIPLTGVHLDGQYAIATDRYKCTAVPLEIPDLKEPMTVPAGFLSQILKQTGEVQIGVQDGMLQIMPDEYTQIKTVLYAEQFPRYGAFFDLEYETYVQLDRRPVLEIMRRADTFAGNSDRVGGALKMYLGQQRIAFVMNNEEVGQIGDVIDTPGYCDHPRVELKFTTKNIIDSLDKGPNDQIEFHYNVENATKIAHIDGGSGYRAWVAGRSEPKPS